MNIFRELARILRVHDDQIEDALANVRRAQTQLSRRGFFAAAGVLATAPLVAPGDRVWSCPQSRIAGLCKVAPPQFPLMIVPGMRFVVSSPR